MKKFAKHWLLLLVISACGRPHAGAEMRSITPLGVRAGKWLVTLSIGGPDMEAASTLALRNIAVDVFSKDRGGLYEHVIDISDTKPYPAPKPSKEAVLQEVRKLTQNVKKFRQENPGAKTMVLFVLTGHGMTRNGNYEYLVDVGQTLSGDEIVEVVKSFDVDETILLVQSCQSGSLPNRHFQKATLAGLAQEISAKTQANNMVVSVVTPVTEEVSSAAELWERDVVKPSFAQDSIDKDRNDIITYEEWKNGLLQLACSNMNYPDIINPQFFDPKFPANLPLILTNKGIERYRSGTLALPPYNNQSAVIWPETRKLCE